MSSFLKLNFPQWQGGNDLYFQKFVPELTEREQLLPGYHLGSQIINLIFPTNKFTDTAEVPIPLTESAEDIKTQNGIYAYNACLRNLKAAVKIVEEKKPDKVVTIGGECSVSVPAFTYFANKHQGKIAIVWIDAHPDIGMPGDAYTGYHAMALAMCMGMGDEKFVQSVKGKVPVENCLLVGLRSMEKEAKERKEKIGLKHITCEEFRNDNNKVIEWLKGTKAEKVLIHLDLDVLDPDDLFVAVGYEVNGMKLKEVADCINLISKNYDVVGLTVAERMPVHDIRLRNMFGSLNLFK